MIRMLRNRFKIINLMNGIPSALVYSPKSDKNLWIGALEHDSHYFVADCDNFIAPQTIDAMVKTNLRVVAPLLRSTTPPFYSNYHAQIDSNGYLQEAVCYYHFLAQEIKGLIEVPVVHCTYLIRKEVLPSIKYADSSTRHEYVIFSDQLRKALGCMSLTAS